MRRESDQVKAIELAAIWRDVQLHRTDDIASDINILKMVAIFCGTGLLISLVLASRGWDLGSGLF
jgi:hypothetical protein